MSHRRIIVAFDDQYDLSVLDMQVIIVQAPAGPRVEVRGQLDLAGAGRLDEAIRSAESASAGTLVLDVSRLDFMDSTGLQIVLDADVRAAEAKRELVLVVGHGAARRVLELVDALPRLQVATVRDE